jgi:hypothetical protein
LKRDPLETTDRSEAPEYRDDLAAFREELIERLKDRPQELSDGTKLLERDIGEWERLYIS